MTEETPAAGHNSSGGIVGEQLKAIVMRYERLAEEKTILSEDQKDIMAEAKGNGFDTKIIRKLIARRKRDRDEVEEEEAMLQLYLDALDPFS